MVTVTFCASVKAVIVALPPCNLTSRPTSVLANRSALATRATLLPVVAPGFSVVAVVFWFRYGPSMNVGVANVQVVWPLLVSVLGANSGCTRNMVSADWTNLMSKILAAAYGVATSKIGSAVPPLV